VVHECAGPDISSVDDLAALVARSRADPRSPRVVPYWGQAVASAAEARDLLAATGAHGLAGDLFVDGSLGSHTAALRLPYADAPGCHGHPYLDAGQVGAHVAACTEAGVQAGFHVIGDAAADTVVDGLRQAARHASTAAVRARAHRVEHLEMVDAAQMATLAELGVVASVQPVFDAWWGGPSGMYVDRLGADRARAMNPFAALHAAGVRLAFGSDAPVTPLGPWAAVRAAVEHRTAGSGVPQETALAAHTTGGHRAAGEPSPLPGRLVPGAPASYAVWELGDEPRCLRTVQDGRVLHDTL
jgi:predicted amidohydrolase YtcJ